MRPKYAAPETRFSCIPLAARGGESHRRLGFKVMRGWYAERGRMHRGNNVSAIKWLCPSILVRLGSPSESLRYRRYRQPNKRNVSYYRQPSTLQLLKINVRPLPRSWEIGETRRNFYRGLSQETIARCNRGNNKWKREQSCASLKWAQIRNPIYIWNPRSNIYLKEVKSLRNYLNLRRLYYRLNFEFHRSPWSRVHG